MKIGIDARLYGPKVGGGGLGRYVSELVTNLQQMDTSNEYVIFLKKDNFHECKITNPRFQKYMADIQWYSLEEQLRMPKIIKNSGVDFMHYPHWNVPIFSKVPFIVTIHDLILLEHPKSAHATTRGVLLHSIKYLGYRIVLEKAIHKSKKIIAISEYTKGSILKHFGIKQKKVSVIHNGVTVLNQDRNVSLSTLGVYEPYFLYVGSAYPHKNLEILLKAFEKISNRFRSAQIVFAGKDDYFYRELKKKLKKYSIHRDQVRFLNFPTDSQIAQLYKRTSLFLFPSKVEGFGLPPLEAMIYGAPVVASDSSSLPEVLREFALYFDEDNSNKIAKYMKVALINPEKLSTQEIEARRHALGYSWKNTAKKVLDLYNNFQFLDL